MSKPAVTDIPEPLLEQRWFGQRIHKLRRVGEIELLDHPFGDVFGLDNRYLRLDRHHVDLWGFARRELRQRLGALGVDQ